MEREKQSTAPAAPDPPKVTPSVPLGDASSLQEDHNESVRLAALHRTGLLNSPPEPEFDRITKLATRLLGTPVAALGLLNEHREYLKSTVGIREPFASNRELPLTDSICKHIVDSDGPIMIEDSRKDPSVRDNVVRIRSSSPLQATGRRKTAAAPWTRL